jgi:DNA-binding CsgD family transcriptional regulator
MNDERPNYSFVLDVRAKRYAELYPSMVPRLNAILASTEPRLRKLMDGFLSAVSAVESGRKQRLRTGYGLTPTEANLALHIIDGGSVSSYAAAAGVTPGTARVQLKSVFAKLGISRQTELVKLGQRIP